MSSSGGGGRSGGISGRGRGNRSRNRGRGSGASVIRHGGGGQGKKRSPHPSSQLAPSQVASAANADANTNNTNNRNNIEENEAEPDPHAVCLVCYDDTLPHQRAILPCGHDGVCGPCHLRLRYLNSDKRCPVCKTTNDRIIVDVDPPAPADTKAQDQAPDAETTTKEGNNGGLDEETHTHRPYGAYEMWGDELGKGFTFRDDVGMFFPTDYYVTTILPIFSLGCNIPNCHFTNESDTYISEAKYNGNSKPNAKQKREVKRQSGMQALNTHLRTEHNLTLCNLCYMARRDFVSQLPRFTPTQLKTHQTHGDGAGSGFAGHPLCEFCRPRRFYDLTRLHEHLNKEHYKCHICDKQGRPNQFFKNYQSLSRHFDREHFLCPHPMCLSARFVVFENEIALRAHERSTHGAAGTGAGGSSKINLEFNVRGSHRRGSDGNDQEAPREEDFRYRLDGEAFVPEALPNQERGREVRQENEPEITNAAHAERTAELRAEAAQMRQAQRVREQAEAFPTLGGDTSTAPVGWTAGSATSLSRRGKGQLTKEEFPALASAPKKKSIAARTLRPSATGGSARGSAGSAKWSSSTPASRVAAATSSAATSSMHSQAFFASGSAIPLNRQSNLAADNFPSLGGGSGSGSSHASANVFAARKRAAQPGMSGRGPAPPTSANFPSLSSTAPVSAQAASQRAAKERLLGAKKLPSQAAMENMMDFPPPRRDDPTFNNDDLASGVDTVRQIKAALGPTKYKELKRLTNYYAAGDMQPDAYVDMSSALFDKGIGDGCFWKYMPKLIESCPSVRDNAEAMRYMENLRVADALQRQEDNVAGRSATQASVSGYAARSYASEGYMPRAVSGKKKGANKEVWKSGGSSAGATKQQQSLSQSKKSAANNATNNGGSTSRKAKAKAKNNELKALAFGGGNK